MATPNPSAATPSTSNSVLLLLAWLWVGIPLAWGVIVTLINAAALFK